jgi:hypothetical protein
MKEAENNKLIAEFMGYELEDVSNFSNEYTKDGEVWVATMSEEDTHLGRHLLFQTSWDWLMPVVDKIESITTDNDDNSDNFFNVMIEVFECNINGGGITICKQGQTKLQGTYKAVVEFIKQIK